MFNRTIKRTAVAVAFAVMTLGAATATAQAPGGGPPRSGMGMGMGMMGAADRPAMIQRLALDDAALKLTDAQKGEIDKLVDGYLAEQKTLREKYPMTQGSPPSQEMMGAMRTARENLNTAVGKVLNDAQRTTWQAAMAARRPQMGPGGPGGPGAGMGPPPAPK
jgi:hypothetical protein